MAKTVEKPVKTEELNSEQKSFLKELFVKEGRSYIESVEIFNKRYPDIEIVDAESFIKIQLNINQ